MDFAFLAISIDHLAGTNGLFYLLYGLAVFVTGLAVGIRLDDVGKSATIARKKACHESNPTPRRPGRFSSKNLIAFFMCIRCLSRIFQRQSRALRFLTGRI